MARKKPSAINGSVLFDVFFEDGSRSSNRKVPASELAGLDGEANARNFLEAQEKKIEDACGQRRPRIKSVVRSAKQ